MELQIIQNKIHEVRGVRVMLDKDLAELYGVETKTLNRAVKRNIERFPERFMFQLTKAEALRCRFGTLNDMPLERGKHMKYLPYAFTEQGVSMLSAVLRSPTAIQVSISIMDAFVAMRNCILARTAESVEIARLRERVLALEQTTEEILGGVNDLSEDMRKDIETIYETIGALSASCRSGVQPEDRSDFELPLKRDSNATETKYLFRTRRLVYLYPKGETRWRFSV